MYIQQVRPPWFRLPVHGDLWLLSTIFVLLAGCSSSPLATSMEVSRAERTLARAEQIRIDHHAGSELALARERLQAARQALIQRDAASADRFAIESSLAAELAIARTELAQANIITDEMQTNLRIMQQEMLRNNQGHQP